MNSKESYTNPEESNRKKVLDNTCFYIEQYLNPGRNWDKEITPKQRIYQIRFANVNWETVSNYIKGMDYQNFLRTPYWKAIATHTKYKAGYRCQLCNSCYNLVTHHRDYSIHGFEHAHMQELTVVCYDCHSKFHDISPKQNLGMRDQFPKRKLKTIVTLTILSAFFVYFLLEPMSFMKITPTKDSKSHKAFHSKW